MPPVQKANTSRTLDLRWRLQALHIPCCSNAFWDTRMIYGKLQKLQKVMNQVQKISEVGQPFACRHLDDTYVTFITRFISPISPWTAQWGSPRTDSRPFGSFSGPLFRRRGAPKMAVNLSGVHPGQIHAHLGASMDSLLGPTLLQRAGT